MKHFLILATRFPGSWIATVFALASIGFLPIITLQCEIKICLDYENHFCAYHQIQMYIWKLSKKKQILCTKENVKKSYKGQVTYSDGIDYDITNKIPEERRNNILFFMRWTFETDHITVQREELMYGPKDLLSWIGGAL